MTETPLTGDYFQDMVLDQLLKWPGAKVQHFFFEGKPIPLARQRSAAIKTAFGKYRAIAFSPKKNVQEKDRIYTCCLDQRPVRFLPPYTVAVKFICEPLKTVAEDYPTGATHGDLSNLIKILEDAIFFDMDKKTKRAIPIYKDDRHIIDMLLFKRLPRAGQKPGIHFWMVKP